MESLNAPWLAHYGEVPANLEYPKITMFEMIERAASHYPSFIAYDFMGTTSTYQQLVRDVHQCARALVSLGIRPGDRVTICLPNVPQAIIMFYAVNLMGAVANMVHPLSSQGEIAFFLKDSGSVAAITLDAFYYKFAAIREETGLDHLIIASIKEALGPLKKVGFALTTGRKIAALPADADIVLWPRLMAAGAAFTGPYRHAGRAEDAAAILYSGGTTGTTKGILLSNLNFNALAMQTVAAGMGNHIVPGSSMLVILPIFHGFGLGVCIHTMLSTGYKCLLIPRFTPESFAELIRKKKPNFIAGVPTLYESMLRNPRMAGADLSCLMGVFSGGDSLSIELKKRFDLFLREHGAKVVIREGYGTTECVTASCLTPMHIAQQGSIGLPFPDTYYKIVAVGTEDEVPYDQEGEICLTGPTVMMGYVNQPKETANTLRRHGDGHIWLHTGDLGTMDARGFIYFRQRIKRMIISSGYSIYPSQLENVLDGHEAVAMSCVIGVADEVKIQKVKAFIVPKAGVTPDEALRESIMAHCRKNIAKYALPWDIEFRPSLPQTLVGKVAYRILEEEESRRAADREEPEVVGLSS